MAGFGLINIGAGLSQMGSAVAQNAGDIEMQNVRAQLDRQSMQLADQLRGGSTIRATQNLDYVQRLNQMRAIYGGLGMKLPDGLQGGDPAAAPAQGSAVPQSSGSAPVDDALRNAQSSLDNRTGQPAAPVIGGSGGNGGGVTGEAVPVGNGKAPALQSLLPPWMTPEQARYMAQADPKGFQDLITEWMKPQDIRVNGALKGPNGYVWRNPAVPEGYTLQDKGDGTQNVVPLEGGPEAVTDIAKREALAKAAGTKNVSGFENYLETGGLGATDENGNLKPRVNMDGYAGRVAMLESHGQANPAPNGRSTASGTDQFINQTWLQNAKKYLPADETKGLSDEQLLALRSNPQDSEIVTNGYAADNARYLRLNKINNVGPAEMYIAHHFGPQGAASILKAPVNTPLDQVLPSDVMKANPDLHGRTVGDVYSIAAHAMKGIGEPQGSDEPTRTEQGTVIPPVSQAAPINRGENYLKARMPQWAQAEEDMYDALPSGQIAEQRALAIADALKQVQSGRYTEDVAGFTAALKTIDPSLPKLLPKDWQRDPAAVEEVLKNNFQSTLQQIRAFSSRPAAIEVQLAAKNFANPNLQPEANLQIIGETVGTLRWERALANDWGEAKKQGWVDPQDYERAWMRANPIQPFIDQAEKQIGPLKGEASSSQGAPNGNANTAKVDPKLVTPDNLAYTAKIHNMRVEQVRKQLGIGQ